MLLLSLALAGPNADTHRVDFLPMMSFNTFEMYSGYLPVASTRQLHYVFLTSQVDPTNDPVLIWFNGGPGCSSMLGWAQEHGPFVIEDDTYTFHYNEYSWNKLANVLYIEMPGGVGFSTCGDSRDCTYDDDSSADDNAEAVKYFYETLFPEYLPNKLYLSGESYAGIYVPYLLDRLDSMKNSGELNTNLVGMIVGNGVTNWDYDTTPAYVEMGYWHGLYDDATYALSVANDCPP